MAHTDEAVIHRVSEMSLEDLVDAIKKHDPAWDPDAALSVLGERLKFVLSVCYEGCDLVISRKDEEGAKQGEEDLSTTCSLPRPVRLQAHQRRKADGRPDMAQPPLGVSQPTPEFLGSHQPEPGQMWRAVDSFNF